MALVRRRVLSRSRRRRSGAAATISQLLSEMYAYVALASLWNLLAGYAGLVSVGQQAYVGLGAYVLFALAILAGISPLLGDPARRHRRGRRRRPGRGPGVPAARPLFRDRHLDRRRSVPAHRVANFRARRRLRHEPAGRHDRSRWRRRGSCATFSNTGSRSRSSSRCLPLIVLLLRSRYGLALKAIRDSELAATCNGIDVRRTKLLVYIVTAFGTAHGRRADLPAEAAHLAGRRVSASTTGPRSSSSSP